MSAVLSIAGKPLGAQPTALSLDELLTALRTGRFRVPAFHPGPRWSEAQRTAFLDSVGRAWPTGAITTWEGGAPSATDALSGAAYALPARPDALWILDGVQRLLALRNAFADDPRAPAWDLARDALVPHPPPEAPDLFSRLAPTVPLRVALDPRSLDGWCAARRDLSRALRDAALALHHRLHAWSLVVLRINPSDTPRASELFQRINPGVFPVPSAAPPLPQRTTWRDVATRFSVLGWGNLGETWIQRAALAIQGRSLTSQVPTSPDGSLSARTEAALLRAMRFLRDDAGVPHLRLLPHPGVCVILARYFDAFPTPVPRHRALLRRWLWRSLLGQRITGAMTDLRQRVRAIQPDDEPATLRTLLAASATEAAPAMSELSPARITHARTQLHACAMASLEPRDLRTGASIAFDPWLSRDKAEYLTTLIPHARDALAARLLHPALPTRALTLWLTSPPNAAVLRSHAISDAARDALVRGDDGAFLAERAETLRRVIADFFARQAAWGAEDSPALSVLASDDDA